MDLMMTGSGAEPRWAVMDVFPMPMPIRHDSTVFPRFLTTNISLDLPYVPFDPDQANFSHSANITVAGSLCFTLVTNTSYRPQCLRLYRQVAVWLDKPSQAIPEANGTAIHGVWPTRVNGGLKLQPKWAPRCHSQRSRESLAPWTGCQSRYASWVVDSFFTMSPRMSTVYSATDPGVNFTSQSPWLWDPANPFDLWLLCGINGSCTDLAPFSMIAGGKIETAEWRWNESSYFESTLNKTKPWSNISFAPTPVCVWPPFIFIVTNLSTDGDVLSCSNDTCLYSLCWNATQHSSAFVARLPRFIPVPVEAPSSMTLFRYRRDFGITAAIVTAIGIAVASATAATVALTSTVQTAQAVNNLSAGVATALATQVNVNSQLKGGITIINQRVDLVQEQVDSLLQLVQLGCEQRWPGLCVTSIPYHNLSRAANLSRQLSHYLMSNWSHGFEGLLLELQQSIIHINSTRVDLAVAEGLTS
nr:uncharacterized protein LOC109729283 isoform X2 [Microcebus murinus]